MTTWAPDPAAVHAEIPQRVPGGFTDTSVPSEAQVVIIIGKVTTEVIAEVSDFDPDQVINPSAPVADQVTLGDLASDAVALGAASRIEDQFFPEQQTSVGPYGVEADGGNQHLYARYRRAVATLEDAIDRPGGTSFVGAMRTPLPAVEAIRARTP